MAGITGIISKHPIKNSERVKLEQSLSLMMSKLVYYPEQKNNTFCDSKIFIGNSVPISSKLNDHYVKNDDLPYHIMVDGTIFIDKNEKKILATRYDIADLNNDYYYLPFLFDHYRHDFVYHLTGWFNIFIHAEQSDEDLLFNDRLGFLPLYYYEDKDHFIFSSKIESLLSSGLLNIIEFDEVTIAEHLFFNYALSDNTYIKNIRTLCEGSFVKISQPAVKINKYWDAGEFFGKEPLNYKQSTEVINQALKDSVGKLLALDIDNLNFSLTGGWDSRLVLSYIPEEVRNNLNIYSFGAAGSDDICIPEYITNNEGLQYTPYILDGNYLENDFLSHAIETIMLSNGTRNYKRSHYIYAIKQISTKSDFILTGIYGDEVLKTGKPIAGTVISANVINLIENGFNPGNTVNSFKSSLIPTLFKIPTDTLCNQIESRLNLLKESYGIYKKSGERYFAFRFMFNLRKYFGNEVNSYNDFTYCFSPFIDYDFLEQYALTNFMVSQYDFKTSSLKQKGQSSWLYYELINKNYPELASYSSSRGYSMKDTKTLSSIPKILYIKGIRKKFKRKRTDVFSTENTFKIFRLMLEENSLLGNLPVFTDEELSTSKDDFYSFIYWLSTIRKKYII